MYYTDSSKPDEVYERHAYTYDKNSNIISETDYLRCESDIETNAENGSSADGTGESTKEDGIDNSIVDDANVYILDRTRVHTYDGLNRLTSSVETDNTTGSVSEYIYEYDNVGNRTKVVEDDITTVFAYNELNQVVRADVSGTDLDVKGYKTYTYDGRGNQISEYDSLTDTYTLNEYYISNCLIRTREVKEDVVLSEQTNVYDGEGKRISRTDNGVVTNYYYEGGMLLYTTDEAGNRTSLNITGTESNVIAGVRYEGSEEVYFYGKDIKGSTSCITDYTGNVIVSYDYDDWGQTIKKGADSFYNQICYAGGVYDELTKLYYLNSRYYNPYTGTFMSQDTVRGSVDDYGSWNLYGYCAGNPVCYVDPSEHWLETVVDGWSFWDSTKEAVKDPSPTNIGFAIWDGVALIIPAVPGSYTAKAGKKVVKATTKKIAKETAEEAAEKVVKEVTEDAIKRARKKRTKDIMNDILKKGGKKSNTSGFNSWLNKGAKNNKVYFGIDKNGNFVYTGITKQSKKKRLWQHNYNGKKFMDLEIQYTNLTRNQARALEQFFIEYGPNKLNKINSIGKGNKYYYDALEWAEKYLGK